MGLYKFRQRKEMDVDYRGKRNPKRWETSQNQAKKVNANANTLSAKVASLIVIAKAKASAFAANDDLIVAAA